MSKFVDNKILLTKTEEIIGYDCDILLKSTSGELTPHGETLLHFLTNSRYFNVEICVVCDSYHGNSYTIKGDYNELETDSEFEKRKQTYLKAQKASLVAKQNKIEHEFKEYQRLKKKFESNL